MHNVAFEELAFEYEFPVSEKPYAAPARDMPTFLGYRREDGRVGTRNYIAVVAASNCAAHTAELIAHSYEGDSLPANVDAERALALTIAGARSTLYISNAYFLPNRSFRTLLTEAARRGVDVRVLANSEKTDVGLTRFGGRAQYEELLGAGVRIFEYQPSMMHSKTWVADGIWSGIGTMNFDNRSLALNNETGLMVLDSLTGATMDSLFLRDLEQAREITLEEFRRRSLWERVRERVAGLLVRVL